MGKRYKYGGKYNLQRSDFATLPEFSTFSKSDDGIVVSFKKQLTTAQERALDRIFQGKQITPKDDFAALATDAEKIDYMARRMGLI